MDHARQAQTLVPEPEETLSSLMAIEMYKSSYWSITPVQTEVRHLDVSAFFNKRASRAILATLLHAFAGHTWPFS